MIELSGVCASYGSVQAISNISISVGEGEAVGLLGKRTARLSYG